MKIINKQLDTASQQILHVNAEDHANITQQLPIPRRFWCHWKLPIDEIQYGIDGKELIDDPNNQCCFNHRVGLPTRKWETDMGNVEVIRVFLTHFNRRTIINYNKHKKYSKNKCRGDGTTEILTVRWNVFKYGVMNIVKNHKGVIMPGTSSKLTNEFSTRIKALCDKIPQVYMGGVVPTAISPTKFHFSTGGRLELTSATPDADRGYENVGDINQEENAHWELHDDKPVFYASEGVYRYHHDKEYKHWYDTFDKYGVKVFWDNGKLIPIEEIIDIPVPLLDINAIILGSQTDRSHYDQEHDNEFISTSNIALGEFAVADVEPDDLLAQLKNFNQYQQQQEFSESDYE
jgi:hypothetical protein